MDAENLLYRLNSGEELEDEELEEVISELRRVVETPGTDGIVLDDTYASLQVLGRSKKFEHVALLERFLEVEDALTVSLVLEILCLEWKRTEDRLEQVLNFALGVNWDFDGDVQETSLKILGVYAGSKSTADSKKGSGRRHEVLRFLFSMFDDDSVEPSVKQTIYRALLRASGTAEEEVPSNFVRLDLKEGGKDRDEKMLEKLRQSSGSSESETRDGSGTTSGMR